MEILDATGLPEDTAIWRYLTLEKFSNLVNSQTLYFCPLSYYSKTDSFEGMLSFPLFQKWVASHEGKDSDITNREYFEIWRQQTNAIMVSCWHLNVAESEAMWKNYGEALAIKTTLGALKNALYDTSDEHSLININCVKYVDFRSDVNPQKEALRIEDVALLKRVEFIHEKELRFYILPEPRFDITPAPIHKPINVSQILDSIIISPFANDELLKKAIEICQKHGISQNKIYKSRLHKNPL